MMPWRMSHLRLRARAAAALLALLVAATGCADSDAPTEPSETGPAARTVSGIATARAEQVFHWTFDGDPQGWIGDFADMPPDHADNDYNLAYDPASPLPLLLADDREVPFLSGVNRSDDLFMFLRRRIDGLRPNTIYEVDFRVQFATRALPGLVGVGGAPAESVYVRVGVSQDEPAPVLDPVDNHFRVPGKANQARDGDLDVVIGNVGKPTNTTPLVYEFKTLDNRDKPITFTTDRSGSAWVFVGTDSGFESLTEIYYSRIRVIFSRL